MDGEVFSFDWGSPCVVAEAPKAAKLWHPSPMSTTRPLSPRPSPLHAAQQRGLGESSDFLCRANHGLETVSRITAIKQCSEETLAMLSSLLQSIAMELSSLRKPRKLPLIQG